MLKTEQDVKVAGALIGFALVWMLAFLTGDFAEERTRNQLFWTVTAAAVAFGGWHFAPAIRDRYRAWSEEPASAPPPDWLTDEEVMKPLRDLMGAPSGPNFFIYRQFERENEKLTANAFRVFGTILPMMESGLLDLKRQGALRHDATHAALLLFAFTQLRRYGEHVPAEFWPLWSVVTGLTPPLNGPSGGGSSSPSRP